MQRKETVEQSIGKQIKKLRKEKGFTQQEFAEEIGISTNYLSDVERGKSSIKLDKLVLIMNKLQCSADDLFVNTLDCGYKVKISKICDTLESMSPEGRETTIQVLDVLTSRLK